MTTPDPSLGKTATPLPRLAYQSTGEGPAVVLVAGLGGLGRFWNPVAQLLARDHRVISFDHPGVGASDSFGPQRIEGIAGALLGLLDQLSIERFACVGHSTGGLVAQALALDRPERVSALVLSSTWARPDRRFRDLFELRRLVLQQAGATAYGVFGQLLGYPAEWYERELAADALPAWTALNAADAANAAEAELIGARIDMLLGYQRADELGAIAQPTLIVAAPDDQIVPFNHAQDLARRMPRATLVPIDGGHFVPTTRTADYVAALRPFLAQNHG